LGPVVRNGAVLILVDKEGEFANRREELINLGPGALAWLHGFQKLRVVTEKTQDMPYAFLNLVQGVILWRLPALATEP
jgi:hypothetical protein